jgi:hypothetical protein
MQVKNQFESMVKNALTICYSKGSRDRSDWYRFDDPDAAVPCDRRAGTAISPEAPE